MVGRLSNFINKSFKRRIICFFAPLIIVFIFIVAFISYYKFYTTIENEKKSSTQVLVNQICTNIDYYFKDIKTVISYFSANKDIITAFESYDSMTLEQRLRLNYNLNDYIQNVNIYKDYIADVLFIGVNGYSGNLPNSYRLSANKKLIDEEWLKPYLKAPERKFSFVPVHPSDYYENMNNLTTPLVISTILPIIEYNKTIGFIIGDMDFTKMNVLIDFQYKKKDMDITMVNQSGLIIFNKDKNLINSQIDGRIIELIGSGNTGSFTYSQKGDNSLLIYSKSNVTGWYVIATIPYSAILEPAYSVFNLIILLLPIVLLVAIFITIVLSSQIERPLSRLVKRIENIDMENYTCQDNDYGVGEITNLGHKFESMLIEINQLIEKVYITEIKQKKAELSTLRAQITPHFIYNSLQLIKTEAILSGSQEISKIVTSLGNLLRYAMENRTSMVTIEEEIDYIKNYLDIYMRRFENRLTYEIHISDEIKPIKIHKMILQPVIENCLKHGFTHNKKNGIITVEGYCVNNAIIIKVRDNGRGISQEHIKELLYQFENDIRSESNIGLLNVHQRIVLTCGSEYGIININSKLEEYTEITLRLRLSDDNV